MENLRMMAIVYLWLLLYLGIISFCSTSIFAQGSFLRLISPNGGERWEIGDKKLIIWDSNINLSNVILEYSVNKGKNWLLIEKNIPNNGSYVWKPIPNTPSANCWVRVSDALDQKLLDVSDRFFIIEKPIEELKSPHLQFSNSYQLISVPILLDNSSPQAVLEDDLGEYDNTKWRLFDYQKKSSNQFPYQEFPDTRNFQPGRSFFLITEKEVAIDAGPGKLVADSVVTLKLETGWNFIANPFNFDIPRIALSHPERGKLITYTRQGWSNPLTSPVTILEPWKGYLLKVSKAANLQIRRLPVTQDAFSLADINLEDLSGWSIQILIRSQGLADSGNYVGAMPGASAALDHYDFYEPPPIGNYVTLYFPHREWRESPDLYTGDFRPLNQESYNWNFEVRSSLQDVIYLTFKGLETLPSEMNVWLLDTMTRQIQNLHLNHSYHFFYSDRDFTRKFRLLVGNQRLISEYFTEAEVIPHKYQLFNNFPNPFNSTTTIHYALPVSDKISLKIYNLLGEEVVTLLNNGIRDSGYHAQQWDGRDHSGKTVASGVYLYRLIVGDFSETKRMIFLK